MVPLMKPWEMRIDWGEAGPSASHAHKSKSIGMSQSNCALAATERQSHSLLNQIRI